MQLPRASGLLLHPTSLPGRFGIGDLGPEAHAFLDFLAETGQTWWQMLPLGPVGYGGSPYQSPSSFAGNPLLISLDRLADRGWLDAGELAAVPDLPAGKVNFDAVRRAQVGVAAPGVPGVRRARGRSGLRGVLREEPGLAGRLCLLPGPPRRPRRQALVRVGAGAGRRASRRPATGGAGRSPRASGSTSSSSTSSRPSGRSCAAGQARGIRLIGDVPIFVAHDSADVWAHPDLYYLDDHGRPQFMAGVPPDFFSEDGQLWGNPLYRWEAHAKDGYAWWLLRIKALLERVDMIRIDHFRGFEAYWAVPAGSETAATGMWVPAPGAPFFTAVRKELGEVPLIAEDLGVITPEVEAMRDEFDMPGMRILQFGFDADPSMEKYLPHRFINNCIAYTGTHDNDTTYGWFHTKEVTTTQPREEVAAAHAFAAKYAHSDGREIHWDMIRVLFASVADTAIAPMQDILGLDSRARMNFPGKASGNWAWRYRAEQLDRKVTDRLAEMTAMYGRWNGPVPADRDPRPRPPTTEGGSAEES